MRSRAGPRVFLSASVPLPTRDPIDFATADVLAIRDAVRALAIAVTEEDAELVFGGHPTITPMIRLQIAPVGSYVGDRFVLFQSRYFTSDFPRENASFKYLELVDEVPGDRRASLLSMRGAMLAGPFDVGVFVGGTKGVEDEYTLFRRLHPDAPALPIASTGAAAARLLEQDAALRRAWPELRDEISYLSLMRGIVRRAPRPDATFGPRRT